LGRIMRKQLVFRVFPSFTACVVFLIFLALYQATDRNFYYVILKFQGIPKAAHPFSDLSSIFIAISCKANGVNVFHPNQCMGGGEYNYSPLLLRLTWLSDLRPFLDWCGIFLSVLCFMSLVLLPPSESYVEMIARSFASISSSMIFACERGNLDLFIFCCVIYVGWLNMRAVGFRMVSYILICALAAMKYYPITLMALMAREKISYILITLTAIAALLVIFVIHLHVGISTPSLSIPRVGPLGMDFGAINVPFGLSILLSPPPSMSVAAVIAYRIPLWAEFGMIVLVLCSVIWSFYARTAYQISLRDLTLEQKIFLISGSVVIVTCFYIAQNIVYREIFLLLCLPGLFKISAASERGMRMRSTKVIVAILFLMWEELFRVAIATAAPPLFGVKLGFGVDILFWLFREFIWWYLVVQLLAIIIGFLSESLINLRMGAGHRLLRRFD